MTTIAIVLASVFAYVVVAVRFAQLNEALLDCPTDAYMCGALWPVGEPALLVFVAVQRFTAWRTDRARRRSKLPEARVRR